MCSAPRPITILVMVGLKKKLRKFVSLLRHLILFSDLFVGGNWSGSMLVSKGSVRASTRGDVGMSWIWD